MDTTWFFHSLDGLLRVATVGTAAYVGVVLLLRLSGNRTLAKTAAFDHVVTVAFGSVLATTLLSKQTTLSEGVTAFLLLALLQYAIAWLIARSRRLQSLFVRQPAVVLHDGVLLREAMLRARVSEADVHAALRQSGVGRIEEVELVVLESDGEFSVVKAQEGTRANVMSGIEDQIIARSGT